jgi:hypothetical protein
MAYDKDIEIKRLRRLVDWLQSDRVLELRATLDAAIRDTFCTLLKEHGSEEFRPSALPSLDDSSSLLAQPKVAPSPGTEDAQARPSSPAPSARGAGARWIHHNLHSECSKCGTFSVYVNMDDHERTCWPSPAVSARQDAGAGEEKPREGALKRLLDDLEAYFDNRADVDHNGERHVPNEAMVLRARVDSARADLLRRAPSSLRGEPVDIGEAPKFQGYHGLWMQGWDAARARALKMSSEPEAKS